MTGSATLTGRSSSAVGTTHDASKVTPCIVISLLAAKPPSPEVVHDKAPVPPGRVFLYDHIDPSWPRMFRIASCCQLPASRPAPGLHPRKGAGRGKNPFLFAMLFEKNIEIFSDPNPSVLCVFSICLPPFRAWTLGAGREAGSWQQDAVETGITSVYCEPMGGYGDSYPATITLEGNVYLHDTDYADSIIVYMADIGTPVAHRRYYINQRQAQETRPANIAQPSIIYLGIPA